MSNFMTFAILLVPNADSLLPMLPAVLMMLTIASMIAIYGNSQAVNPTKLFENMTLGNKLAIVVGAQVLLLLGFAAKYQMVLANAQTTITLATSPFDPFDPFRGNYYTFRYDVADLSNCMPPDGSVPFQPGQMIYVTLAKGIPGWKAVAISNRLQKPEENQVALKAVVTSASRNSLYVHYGLEQFFYSETKNPNIRSKALATLKVNNNGDAILTNLEPLAQEPTQPTFPRRFRGNNFVTR